jgi:hypothetical protein
MTKPDMQLHCIVLLGFLYALGAINLATLRIFHIGFNVKPILACNKKWDYVMSLSNGIFVTKKW